MSTGTIVAIVVVVIVVAALIAVGAFVARRRRLQRTFGPEYDRAVESSDSRLKAEAELAERQKRVRHLDIRPLNAAARASYAARWTEIQQQFVDSPAAAVSGAQILITSVMRDEGYPTDDADQIMADLSVEHATTLEHFRTAQELSSRASGGTASTEDLRQAMVHYRELFRELLGDQPGAPVSQTPVPDATDSAARVPDAPVPDVPVSDAPAYDPSVTAPDTQPPYASGDDATAASALGSSETASVDAFPAGPGEPASDRAVPATAEAPVTPAPPASAAPASPAAPAADNETAPAAAGRSGQRR